MADKSAPIILAVSRQRLKRNPKFRRISKTAKRGKMAPDRKYVTGPLDPERRVRGNKAGRGRVYLPVGHVSRCH